MAKLYLEYGKNSQPIHLEDDEARLLQNSPNHRHLTHYFEKKSNGDFIVKKPFFYKSKKVSDVYRYDLRYIKKQWTLVFPNTRTPGCSCCHKQRDISVDPTKNNILVILESPHKDEYCEKYLKPLAPANGQTGENFYHYFTKHVLNNNNLLISKLKKRTTYSICFVNPVPFQTSLHFIHKNMPTTLRDKVWAELFPDCRLDFLKRMKFYSKSNAVIILNSCTESLKCYVKITIDSAITKKIINCTDKFKTPHPSSGHWANHKCKTLCTAW